MRTYLIFIALIALASVGFIVWRSQSSSGSNTLSQPVVTTAQSDEPGNTPSQYDRYEEYSAASYNQAAGKKRVLFFHASWCPTCKEANEEFEKNASAIPENVVVYKTDYDTNPELKKKYGVTYQHTFVQVDEKGNAVKKWNGGGSTELMQQVK